MTKINGVLALFHRSTTIRFTRDGRNLDGASFRGCYNYRLEGARATMQPTSSCTNDRRRAAIDGAYQCVATNAWGTAISNTTRLKLPSRLNLYGKAYCWTNKMVYWLRSWHALYGLAQTSMIRPSARQVYAGNYGQFYSYFTCCSRGCRGF